MSLADEIRTVQRLLGVEPDGVAGPRTVEAMRQALDQLAALKAQGARGLAETGQGATKPPAVAPGGLSDPAAFYGALRGSLGALDQGQVDGFNRLLAAMAADRWPLAWAAYGLATPWWETNKRMQPVEEGYYLGEAKAKAHQRGLRYYPWYGRGDVQLTWEQNYKSADAALGLGGALVANPDLALDGPTSARILVWGMRTGAFTGKGLGDYLSAVGPADTPAFKQARRIINGQDKAPEIAAIALKFQAALEAGGWQ